MHSMFGGSDWRWRRPLGWGERVHAVVRFVDLIERGSEFAGRSFQQVSEITFKTDPKNADYVCEQGATRNFENWAETTDKRTKALPGAEADDEYDSDGNLKEESKERNAMEDLERAQEQSRREMEMMDELSDLR